MISQFGNDWKHVMTGSAIRNIDVQNIKHIKMRNNAKIVLKCVLSNDI